MDSGKRRGAFTSLAALGLAFCFLQGTAAAAAGSPTAAAASGGDINSKANEPTFATTGKTFRIVTKDTVVLPCEVTNPGSYVLVWKRGNAVLTAGPTKVSPDDRLQLVDGYNLQIRDVATSDAGDYQCQIGTLEPKEITHTVEILVPPRIHYVTSKGEMQVKKGYPVTLECRASGNPVPTITWTRKNNLLPSGEKSVVGFSITISQATRHHAGVYECTASNTVGEPVTHRITLHVQYAPEIEVEKTWVHSGEGYEAQLVCIVHAEPPAEVVWYRNTLRIDTSERHIMEVRGSRHTLILRKVQSSDFGNYSCVADNLLGKAREHLELSGVPNMAEFNSHPVGRYTQRYNLTWSVVSFSPIEEFKLSYRKLPRSPHGEKLQAQNPKRSGQKDNETYVIPGSSQRQGEWNKVVLSTPVSTAGEHTRQTMSYMIHSLEPGVQYEATVQAKNRFGWNQVSQPFAFSTGSSEPEVRDMEVIAAGNVNPNAAAGRAGLAASALLVALMNAAAAVFLGTPGALRPAPPAVAALAVAIAVAAAAPRS